MMEPVGLLRVNFSRSISLFVATVPANPCTLRSAPSPNSLVNVDFGDGDGLAFDSFIDLAVAGDGGVLNMREADMDRAVPGPPDTVLVFLVREGVEPIFKGAARGKAANSNSTSSSYFLRRRVGALDVALVMVKECFCEARFYEAAIQTVISDRL